jgi:uncharacterized protein (UPF0261 family)
MMYTIVVHRTQILLKDEQHRALAAMSRRTGRGLSSLVRDAVDAMLGGGKTAAATRRLSDIRALGRDPKGPPASEHDRLLYGGGA